MATYSMYARPTIVALSSAPPRPEKLKRRSNTISSGTTLVQDMPFCFAPSSLIPVHTGDFDGMPFDNTPPLPLSHGISDACFGLPYAQRCDASQSENLRAQPQRRQTVSGTLVRKNHIRRAGRVQVDVGRFSSLEKAAARLTGALRFGNRAANNRRPNSLNSAFGSDHYNQPAPAAVFAESAAAVGAELRTNLQTEQTVDGHDLCFNNASTDCNSNAAQESVNIFRISGVATLSTHKPQLVTISSVAGHYAIVPSQA